MFKNNFLLMSGADIPFQEGKLVVHQPRLKEISLLGDRDFLTGVEFLNFSKDRLQVKDKTVLENQSNFDILMTVMGNSEAELQYAKNCGIMLFTIMFPDYQIQFLPNRILFVKPVIGEEEFENGYIDQRNYEQFKEIVQSVFCLNELMSGQVGNYNPANDRAAMLVKKFEDRRKKIAELKPDDEQEPSLFQRYVSILAVGEQKNINELMDYTVFQLLDEYNRYILKTDYDTWFSAKLAGAKDMKMPDNWMK